MGTVVIWPIPAMGAIFHPPESVWRLHAGAVTDIAKRDEFVINIKWLMIMAYACGPGSTIALMRRYLALAE